MEFHFRAGFPDRNAVENVVRLEQKMGLKGHLLSPALGLTRALTSVGERPLVAQSWYIWSNKCPWYR